MSDNFDPKEIVKKGYDQIADQYLEWVKGVRIEERQKYTDLILKSLPEGASVLELGCGAGDPTTVNLAQKFKVTGVDISDTQIERAKINVPSARFIREDMTKLNLPDNEFDGVAAFYSITHIPREEHLPLLKKINGWLKQGGLLVLSMSHGSTEGMSEEWIANKQMFFSGFDPETNKKLITEAGFEIISALEETDVEFDEPTTFLWVVARKI